MRHLEHFITVFCVVVSGFSSGSVVDNLQHVGCYDPSYSLRQKYHHHMASVNLAKCVQFCQALKTQFAAVEASVNYCHCGGDIPEESVKRNDTLCNIPCPDEPLRACGGDWLMSVYDIHGASSVDVVEEVDFLLGISTGVRIYHSRNPVTYDTLMNTSEWVYSVDYHFSKNILFAYLKNKLYRTTLDPKRSSSTTTQGSQLVKNVSPCDGFAVDWVHDRVYVANCNPNITSIISFGLTGEAEETVIAREELTGKVLKRMEVDPYKGMVFWTSDGVVQSVDTSGEGFNPNMTTDDVNVRALTLDLRARRVYYVAIVNQTNSLFSMDYNGDDVVEHFSVPQLRSVYGINILGDKVFWVNYANIRDVIYEAPLNFTGVDDVKMIRAIDRAVWHMRVVHPMLQTRPKIDPCLDRGCSYSCVAVGSTSARCKCPPGQSLRYDGVTCGAVASIKRPTATAGVFYFSILLVVILLTMSLALVYVGNKYWSLLETKLFNIPYSRNRGREGEEDVRVNSTEYHTGEDSVNLI